MTPARAAAFMRPAGVARTASRVLLVHGAHGQRLGRLTAGLSGAERAVARGFRARDARAEYISSRSVCRLLQIDAPVFPRAPRGQRAGRTAPTVSLSHSRGLMAFATARGVPIGVDVEAVDAPPRLVQGVRRALVASDIGETDRCCWDAWCRKEALVKGLRSGVGGLAGLPPLGNAHCRVTTGKGMGWTVTSVMCFPQAGLAYAIGGPARRARVAAVSLARLLGGRKTRTAIVTRTKTAAATASAPRTRTNTADATWAATGTGTAGATAATTTTTTTPARTTATRTAITAGTSPCH